MVSYHSRYCDIPNNEIACGIAILPLKTQFLGPAPKMDINSEEEDIVDEAISQFRA